MSENRATADPAASDTADREIVVSRLIEAPPDLVFEAWTDPRHVAKWWGPRGFTTTTHEMDVRPGGDWRLTMHGPDGRDYYNHIVFDEVVRPERLVYRHVPETGTEPVSFQTTVTFVAQGSATLLSMRMLFPSAKARDYVAEKYGALEGAHQTIERLAEFVEQRHP